MLSSIPHLPMQPLQLDNGHITKLRPSTQADHVLLLHTAHTKYLRSIQRQSGVLLAEVISDYPWAIYIENCIEC